VTISINAIEALWILINATAFAFTAVALWAAWQDRKAVLLLNGAARQLQTAANVRREGLRLLVQALFLALIVPSVFSDADIKLSYGLVIIMAIPLVLLISTVLDARDRGRLTNMVVATMESKRDAGLKRIEQQGTEMAAAMIENTRVSQEASDRADAAYHEANSVNAKIASQGAALAEQQSELAEERAFRNKSSDRIEGTVDDTHEKVIDIHEALDSGTPAPHKAKGRKQT
jgi:hypothetical protein